MFKLADGSGKLAGGLHDGAAKIPDYDKQDRDARTGVMADPVQLASPVAAQGAQLRHRFRPVLHPAVPVGRRDGGVHAHPAAQPAGAGRRRLRPGASPWPAGCRWPRSGVLQTAALMSVLHWGLGLEMARAAGTVGFLLLVTGLLRRDRAVAERPLRAGRADPRPGAADAPADLGGRHVSRADQPRLLQRVHPFLPMSYVVEGLRRLITGGGLGPVWRAARCCSRFTAGRSRSPRGPRGASRCGRWTGCTRS